MSNNPFPLRKQDLLKAYRTMRLILDRGACTTSSQRAISRASSTSAGEEALGTGRSQRRPSANLTSSDPRSLR